MYISRVEIDMDNRKKIRDLTHVGAYHNWVERSFPSEIQEKSRSRKLWRLDAIGGKSYLLVVSETKPELEMFERYGVKGSVQIKAYHHFLFSLQKGNRMRFRVVLNPVKTFSMGVGNRGETKPIYTTEEQMNYLIERAEKNGFLLNAEDFSVVEKGNVVLKKANQSSTRLNKAVYEGNLTISDVELFKNLLTLGMGKHKAYGFGMMTVIPMVD